MAVGHGHPQALGGDGGGVCVDDDPIFHPAPNLQRLLLALLLLAADVGDQVIHHLRPGLKGLTGSGDGLIGAHQNLLNAIAQQGGEGGDIALDGAVGFHGDKATLGAQPLFLGGDDLQVLGVDLGNHHGHVGGPAVGGVVGHHRALMAGIFLLQGLDGVLGHVHSGEDKVHLAGDGLHVVLGAEQHHVLCHLRDGHVHGPAARYGLLIPLPGRAGAGGQNGEAEPGVVGQQGDETLAHHAGGADDTYFVFMHGNDLLLPTGKKWLKRGRMLYYNRTAYASR